MKNIELYKTIEALVQNKNRSYKPGKPFITQQYCKQQIQRKKLVSLNQKSKMNRLMKNFRQMDTYVDMQQLFQQVKKLIIEKQRIEQKSHKNIGFKSRVNIGFNDEYEIIMKARQLIGPHIYKIYMKENEELKKLIGELESQSCVGTYRRQNSPVNDDESYCVRNWKEAEVEDSAVLNEKDEWRFYQGNNYILEDASGMKKSQSCEIERRLYEPSLKKRQENVELIHQVATYLQIVLENVHRRKWNYKKVGHGESQRVPKLLRGKKFLGNQRRGNRGGQKNKEERHTTGLIYPKILVRNGNGQGKLGQSLSIKRSRSTVKNLRLDGVGSDFLMRRDVKQNFTFRNRNIKQGVIKKLDEFIDFIEWQQKQLKKEKNTTNNEINYLENKSKILYERYLQKQVSVDEYEIKRIQNMVHQQNYK